MPNIRTTSNPSALARIVEHVESSGDLTALRFEPLEFDALRETQIVRTIQTVNRCTLQTANVIYATSYGLFQIMGFNIYSVCRVTEPILDFWDSPAAQYFAFQKFIESNQVNFSWQQMKSDPKLLYQFARVYNGNSTMYSSAMLSAARSLGL